MNKFDEFNDWRVVAAVILAALITAGSAVALWLAL